MECDFEKDKQLITNEKNAQLEFETFQSLVKASSKVS